MSEGPLNHSLVEPLTRRELEILHLLLENFSNNQIADKLTLAPSSVKWYVKQIYAKLGVNGRNQVAERAIELGLIPNEQPSSPPKHNLPSSMTPFVGRQSQIEQVRRMVIDPKCRLITLTGAGGVGKTRLALKIAESSFTTFKHGVWLVELASVNNADLLVQSIASVFGLRGNHDRSAKDLLHDFLHEKKLLLILDNCEQLIEVCARLVESLLRYCPELHILVTSREALDIEGEIPFKVPSLTFPDPVHLPDIKSLPQYEAVLLFIERTQVFIPAFSITETNARDIVRICQRLDGIPLALELAAARVKVMGVDQIATHLDESFQLLAGGFRTALPRHQTMRASINWSYQLLTETERCLLRRFSVFSDGWTLEAAKEVCTDETFSAYTVIDLLTELVDKSLVTVKNEPLGGIRFFLLDAIDEFAEEKLLEANEGQGIYDSHLNYFLNLGETAEPNLHGPEQISWLDRLAHELPNVRVALDWGLKTNADAEIRLASAMALFWYIRGQISEGLSWLTKGLNALTIEDKSQAPTGQTENIVRRRLAHAKALAAAGFLWKMGSEYKKSMIALEESLAIYRDIKEEAQAGLAYTLLQLASCATVVGNYDQANGYATESLAIYQANNDSFGISECFMALGNNETDPTQAKKLLLEAMDIKRKIGDINGLAFTLQLLCDITVYETDFERASAWLEESLDVYQKVGNNKSVVNCLYNLAWIAWVNGEYQLATQRINESISLCQEIQEKALLATDLLMRSDIKLSQGYYDDCNDDIQAAIKIGQEMGYQTTIAAAQVKQGRLALVQGQIDQALKTLHEGLTLSRSLDNKRNIAFGLYNMGRAAYEQNDLASAKTFFQQSMRLFYEMNFWYWDYIAYSLEGLAKLSLPQHADQAARLYGAANRLFQGLANTLSPIERKWREDNLMSARMILGDEPYQCLWDEGHASTTEEAMQIIE